MISRDITITDGDESVTVTIAEIPRAKSLRYSVAVDGTEYARVISQPIAEKLGPELGRDHLVSRRAISEMLGEARKREEA